MIQIENIDNIIYKRNSLNRTGFEIALLECDHSINNNLFNVFNVNINLINAFGNNMLHILCEEVCKNYSVIICQNIELLLKKNVNLINKINNYNMNPVDMGIKYLKSKGSLSIIKILILNSNYELTVKQFFGIINHLTTTKQLAEITTIMDRYKENNPEYFERLKQVRDTNGYSIFHNMITLSDFSKCRYQENTLIFMEMLYNYGFDINLKNNENLTPLEFTIKHLDILIKSNNNKESSPIVIRYKKLIDYIRTKE